MENSDLSGAGGSLKETNSPNPSLAPTPAQSPNAGAESPPASISEKNDNGGKNKSARAHKIRENIRRAAGKIADKFGVLYKRGRGRPRADGQPKGNDTRIGGENSVEIPELDLDPSHDGAGSALDTAPGDNSGGPVVRSEVNELFTEFVGATASGSVDGVWKVSNFAGQFIGVPEKEVSYYLELAKPDQAPVSRFARALKLYVEKTGWKPENVEFLMLMAALVEIGTPWAMAAGLIAKRALEIRREKLERLEAARTREISPGA